MDSQTSGVHDILLKVKTELFFKDLENIAKLS